MAGRAKRREALRLKAETLQQTQRASRKRALFAAGLFALVSIITVIGVRAFTTQDSAPVVVVTPPKPQTGPHYPSPAPIPATNPAFPSLAEIIAMKPADLAKVDIAVVNLRCAEGLPGAEKIDIAAALQKLDGWAARVKEETTRYAYKARDSERYRGVSGKYEMDMLTTVLQQNAGIHYDPSMAALLGKEGSPEDTFFDDTKNVFINGLTDQQMGTCSSMPVLYCAIARRLGYPVFLAEAANHLYCQWDDGRNRFNIECTSRGGLMSHPDDYYWHWPQPVSPKAAELLHYFKPLSPRDELALALSNRAVVLGTMGNLVGAIRCQMQAVDLTEHNKHGMEFMLTVFKRTMDQRQVDQADALLDEQYRRRASQPSFEPYAGIQPTHP